jgi:hypothetical protein
MLIAMRRYAEAQHAIDNALLVNPHAYFFSIQRASIDLKKNGDTAPLRAGLGAIPRDFDPGGAMTTVGIRLNLMEGDFAEAARTRFGARTTRHTGRSAEWTDTGNFASRTGVGRTARRPALRENRRLASAEKT